MAKKNTTTTTTSSSTNVVVHDFTSADLKVLHKKVTMYNAVVKQLAEGTADKDGKRNKNGISFVSGHGISKKKWDLKKKDRKDWSDNDSKACEYYDKADKLLIDQYCFADINIARRINDIASRVEAAVDAEKARLIDTIGVKEYNRLYNALESEKEESEEEVA